jgi:hypothetical protein
MKKEVILIICAISWFIVGGVLFSSKLQIIEWVSTLFIYLWAFQWIYAFFLKKTMYLLYVNLPFNNKSEGNKPIRLVFLLLGITLFILASVK